MPSNYPPGVSGGEYEIAGPDEEYDTEDYCSYCDRETEGTIQRYGFERVFTCAVCEKDTALADEED